MRHSCILSQHLLNLYIDSVIREAEFEELGIKSGGKLAYNLRYTDDTALCAESQEKPERLGHTIRDGGCELVNIAKWNG